MSTFSETELETLREGGKRLARVMESVVARIAPGVTTEELEDHARAEIEKLGDVPAFLGYQPGGATRPYPAAICTSVNDEVVHGIPNKHPRTLKEGDIITVDIGLVHNKLITDMAYTVSVGQSELNERLINTAQEALKRAIAAARPGNTTGDIAHAVESFVKGKGFSVPHELGGHAVGRAVHEEPFIPNVGNPGEGETLERGMVLAIEPIVMEKGGEVVLESDGYTFRSSDGGRAAQFEHTIIVTDGDAEIVTIA